MAVQESNVLRVDGVSALRHLVNSIFGFWEGTRKLMAVYTAYFDDSGHENQKYLVCAGHVIDVEEPEKFDRGWLEAISPLTFLHTKDFVGGYGQYAEWKGRGPEKREILCRAAKFIGQKAFQTFSVVLAMDDYERLNRESAFSESLARPFALCARFASVQLQDWNRQNERIKMVFEQREEGEGDVVDIFARDGLPRPSFEEKKLTPLQAADLLAWAYDSKYSRPDAYQRIGREIIGEIPAALHTHDFISYPDLVRITKRVAGIAGFDIPERPPAKPIAFHNARKRDRLPYKRPKP